MEQGTHKPLDVGSNPTLATNYLKRAGFAATAKPALFFLLTGLAQCFGHPLLQLLPLHVGQVRRRVEQKVIRRGHRLVFDGPANFVASPKPTWELEALSFRRPLLGGLAGREHAIRQPGAAKISATALTALPPPRQRLADLISQVTRVPILPVKRTPLPPPPAASVEKFS